MQRIAHFGICLLLVAVMLLEPEILVAQNRQADEALAEGAAFVRRREFEKARPPLETALNLAPDAKYRIRVYNILMPVYRQLPEPDKMIEACEFTIRFSDSLAERSTTATSLASFLYQRGKADEYAKRYREVLAKDADDFAALAVMSQLARAINLEKAQVEEYRDRYRKAERQVAAELAVGREKQATEDATLRTWLWHEAASYWSKAGEHAKAVAAARKAEQTGPEARTSLLTYFWHDHLGEVFLAAGEYQSAIDHLEKAIAATTIKGSQESSQKRLDEAKAKLAEKK